MKQYVILMMLIYLNELCSCEVKSVKTHKVLSRKKRYLSFPEGSSAVTIGLLGRMISPSQGRYIPTIPASERAKTVRDALDGATTVIGTVINLSFANSYIWDYSPLPRPSWNSLCEADIGFKLPNNSRVFYGSRTRRSRRSNHLHRSERLELFRNTECLLDMFGVDGRPCLIRTLCEAKKVLKPGRSLVEDILHIVFTIPNGQGDEFEAEGYNGPRTEMFCESFEKRCPFSLLEYLLYD